VVRDGAVGLVLSQEAARLMAEVLAERKVVVSLSMKLTRTAEEGGSVAFVGSCRCRSFSGRRSKRRCSCCRSEQLEPRPKGRGLLSGILLCPAGFSIKYVALIT
jgi:hypothetical protein